MRQKSELRGYQNRIVSFLYERDEAALVVPMGGGKTVSTATALQELLADGEIRHAFVVAPKRVANNVWPSELREWAHTAGLRQAVLSGTPAQRLALLKTAADRDVSIIGIDNLVWLAGELAQLPADSPLFDAIVFDEVSKFRDPGSKRAKAVRPLMPRFKIRWGLTGTITPSGPQDAFGPVKLLTCGKLWGHSYTAWRAKHFYPTDYRQYDWQVLPGHDVVIAREFGKIAMTLDEDDMPDMPDLSVIVDTVDLPPEARRAYKSMETKLFAELDDRDVVAMSSAVATGKLAQIANGFLYAEAGNTDVEQLHEEKLEWLDDLEESSGGEPLMVVYEFVEDLERLKRRYGSDLPFLGGGVSDALARDYIEAWNAGALPLLALHPASAAHGLNLQAGGHRQAWLSPPWSPELWAQCIARLHRPGQAHKVTVHVCTAADTVDQMKLARVHSKLSAQAAFESYLRNQGLKRPATIGALA
jgi:hypothetical protein